MDSINWSRFSREISDVFDLPIAQPVVVRPVTGGSISAAWQLDDSERRYFIKTGSENALPMFNCELDGLQALAKAKAVRVPQAIACGQVGANSVLVVEWLDFGATGAASDALLGTLLAQQHRVSNEAFGWHQDNFIGSTRQPNTWSENWLAFFREHRLGWQLELADRNGYGKELQSVGRDLHDHLEAFFASYEPTASLLHGDLWGGNHATVDGVPVIFDPAVHYGDRESDIAMSKLFGGFSGEFYRAYNTAWPLAAGHEQRLELYQLYHLLNHLNLFGEAYLSRALAVMRSLLRDQG